MAVRIRIRIHVHVHPPASPPYIREKDGPPRCVARTWAWCPAGTAQYVFFFSSTERPPGPMFTRRMRPPTIAREG